MQNDLHPPVSGYIPGNAYSRWIARRETIERNIKKAAAKFTAGLQQLEIPAKSKGMALPVAAAQQKELTNEERFLAGHPFEVKDVVGIFRYDPFAPTPRGVIRTQDWMYSNGTWMFYCSIEYITSKEVNYFRVYFKGDVHKGFFRFDQLTFREGGLLL